MGYGTGNYGSTEYAGLLGIGVPVPSSPAGTEYEVPAEDRSINLQVQPDPVVPFENREVSMPSASIDPQTFIKDGEAIKDYSIDWSNILESGEAIDSSSWDGGGLTASGGYILGDRTYIFLAGGTAATEYVVSNVIITSLGRTYVRQFFIAIQAT